MSSHIYVQNVHVMMYKNIVDPANVQYTKKWGQVINFSRVNADCINGLKVL